MQESLDVIKQKQTSSAPLRYASLDHWRGVAALGVMMFHSFGAIRMAGQSVHPSIQWLKWSSDFGWFGVHLFFVISGYCIAANVYHLVQHRLSPLDFLKDRLLRIYPTYWGACLFALVLALVSMPFNHTSLAHNLPSSLGEAAANILLVEPYAGVSPFLLVSWSLVYELGFYVLVAVGFALERAGMRFSWVLVAAITLGFLGLFGPWKGALSILNFWPEFLTGSMVFIALWLNVRGIESARLLLLVPVAFAVTGIFTLPNLERIGQMLGASLFALALYFLHPFDYRIANWYPLTWLAWVGAFSYSLYLVHVPLGRVINLGSRVIPHNSVWFVCLVVGHWIVGIAVAWTFYKFCEQPLERWRHRLRRRTASIVVSRDFSRNVTQASTPENSG